MIATLSESDISSPPAFCRVEEECTTKGALAFEPSLLKQTRTDDIRSYVRDSMMSGTVNESPVPSLESLQATPVTSFEKKAEWFLESVQAVNRLGSLSPNWDSYGAEPPNSDSLYAARIVLDTLASMDFRPTSTDASAEGGVCLAFSSCDFYADIECFNSGEIWTIVSEDDTGMVVDQVACNAQSIRDAADRIRSRMAERTVRK